MSPRTTAPFRVRAARAAFGAASVAVLALTGAAYATPGIANAAPATGSAAPSNAPKTLEQPLAEWRWQAPVLKCYEDEPCWRVWMGDGTYGPTAPDYMFAPEGVPDAWADDPCFRGEAPDLTAGPPSNQYCPGQPNYPYFAPHSFYWVWGPKATVN